MNERKTTILAAAACAAALMAQEPQGTPLQLVPAGPMPERSAGRLNRTYQRRKVDAVSHDREGIAILGYDVVSYLDRKPAKGRTEYSAEYGGAVWLFATADNRDAFRRDPERYLPQYGGFCAYSVSLGSPAHADPGVFAVSGGKLYLFFDSAVRLVWEQDRDHTVTEANTRWPGLHR